MQAPLIHLIVGARPTISGVDVLQLIPQISQICPLGLGEKIFVFQVTRPTRGKNPRPKKVYGTFGLKILHCNVYFLVCVFFSGFTVKCMIVPAAVKHTIYLDWPNQEIFDIPVPLLNPR